MIEFERNWSGFEFAFRGGVVQLQAAGAVLVTPTKFFHARCDTYCMMG
jgi:hypothetical protein